MDAIARQAGNADLQVLEDWGRSGRGAKVHLRTEYQRLLTMVRADQVEVIYAYNWSRLGRSTRDILDLTSLCREHDTGIVTCTGMSVDPSTADGRMMLTILSAVDEWQAEVQAERMREAIVSRQRKWDAENPGVPMPPNKPRYGAKDGEDESVVLKAFAEAGTYNGAARVLNDAGVPTRQGAPWSHSSIRRIVERTRPTLVRKKRGRGLTARAKHVFAGLLECPCGNTMASEPTWTGRVRYICKRASQVSNHRRPYSVQESVVRAWAQDALQNMREITFAPRRLTRTHWQRPWRRWTSVRHAGWSNTPRG